MPRVAAMLTALVICLTAKVCCEERTEFAAAASARLTRRDEQLAAFALRDSSASLAVPVIGTGYRISRNAKSHQDIVMTTLLGIGYLILNQMLEHLEEGS